MHSILDNGLNFALENYFDEKQKSLNCVCDRKIVKAPFYKHGSNCGITYFEIDGIFRITKI